MENQLLFFFSAIGVFNGFLLSLYILIFIRPRRLTNTLFGMLILVLSIRIGKSIFYFFLRDLSKIYLQIGLSACFFIGPFLFFYVKSVLKSIENLTYQIKFHIITLFSTVILAGFIYPYPIYPDIWNHYYIHIIYLEWMTYVIATGFLLKNIIPKSISFPSSLSLTERWLIVIYIANLIICTAYFGAFYFKSSTWYIFAPISFSLLFYGLSIFLLFQSNNSLFFSLPSSKYSKKRILDQEASNLLNQLEHLMQEKSLYKNPNLKLKDLAKELSISGHYLSQLLNDNLGKNFSIYVNEYRIQAAEKLLSTHPHYHMEAISEEVGFNSKSTFYTAFKKIKGMTPSSLREQVAQLKKLN